MAALFLLLILFHFQPPWDALALAPTSENDFSYMKVVSNATNLPRSAEYDYIVIGGGTAGCPLAATLSRNYSVLLLERGSAPSTYPEVLQADQAEANLLNDDDGKNPVQKFKSEEGVEIARGRVLGGSSMINIGFYSRAEKEFYPKSGINWDSDVVEKAYQWVEETIVHRSDLLPWQSTFKDALLEAGLVPDNGFTLEHIVGTKASGSLFDGLGRRHGAVELLNRGDFRNLRVAVRASVEKILFTRTKRGGLAANGVQYRDSRGMPHRAFVRAKGEVILSAGAIGSPQLLLLSGVGPVSDLSSQLIPVVQPQPDVGKFMADNPRSNIGIVVPFSLNASYAQVVGIATDFYIESLSTIKPFASLTKPSGVYGNISTPIDLSVVFLANKVPGPLSIGSLALASRNNVSVGPKVRFNYFSEPEDLARCVKGMRKVGDMLRTKAFAALKFDKNAQGENGFKFVGPTLPVNYRTDNSSLEAFCRSNITTWWHYHGGCRVGKVVDGDFRFTGINALRVVDGSVFTSSPGTNPQATLMMIGRYVGLKMLRQRAT
ncbi:(R)-mandelonitrile lyase 1 [Morus notabilis]|uniref:(R)-mandelonitrile lyase 1 n=1 Tax=Morus notabilis TaxID=981085 RepID=UPI000CED04EA|nr:(R)-mandelonitrile lyase 1 [Morus notabilis]